MTTRFLLFFCFNLLLLTHTNAQQLLQKGFDKNEYIQLMYASARQIDTPWVNAKFPLPTDFKLAYRSPVVGLANRWDLWTGNNGIAIISLRGTTNSSVSWLENFYAGMVSATGSLKVDNKYTFNYKLAENPRATVHIGWLLGTACLAPTIITKVDSLYRTGTKNILIIGHSQGGALAYLLTAHLHYLQKSGRLPADMYFKTYCSAAPKPGNLYFAYDYESYTQQGWAYNVVNADDWVPESPVTLQIITDFNEVNPFIDAKKTIKKQKFGLKIAMGVVYRNLVRPSRKAQRKNLKYLGVKTSKMVKKTLPEFKEPPFVKSSNYNRAGNFITLLGDAEYHKKFPNDKDKVFIHHMWEPYLYLINQWQP